MRVHFVCVSDEESDEIEERGSDYVVEQGYTGDFAITGEPTDLHIGVEAKGVLAMRLEITGVSAHGSTPWLGDNAVLKAVDVFRSIESMAFSRESSDLFDRPSLNLGRILGGDAVNKVPDSCCIDVDIRFLPGQDPAAIEAEIETLPDTRVVKSFKRAPIHVEHDNRYVQRARRGDRGGGRHRRQALGRPRRDLGRDLVHRRRRAGGRVRSGGRRSSRARGVGLDRLARTVPARAGAVRQAGARSASAARARTADLRIA